MMLSLLGTAAPSDLRGWFSRLSDGGRIVDDLQKRPWGDSDGQVIDRYGVHWLIGFAGDESA
jgi:PhnB protein